MTEHFRRKSFIIFAFLVLAFVIGVLETVRPAHVLPNSEDRAVILAAATTQLASKPMWAIVCAERDSALRQSARLKSFIERHDYTPTAEEAIVDGCSWAAVSIHSP